MVAIIKTASILLSAVATLATAAAIPTEQSPASMLTSESLEKRQSRAVCWQPTGNICPRGDAIAAVNYLRGLGNTRCEINGMLSIYVVAGKCKITGQNYGPNMKVGTTCRQVADSLNWVLDSCRIGNGQVGGANSINGNDRIGAMITGFMWG